MREQKNNRGDRDSSGKKDFSRGSRSEGRSPERRERSSDSRSESRYGDRKESRGEGRSESRYGDRKEKSYGDRSENKFGDRKPRSFESRGEGSKFGDRKPRSSEGRYGENKERTFESRGESRFSDRKPRSSDSRSESRYADSRSSDRKPRSFEGRSEGRYGEGNSSDRKPRSFEGRSEGSKFGDRKPRSTEGRYSERAERNYQGKSESRYSDRKSTSFDNKRVGSSGHKKESFFDEGIKYSEPLDLTNPQNDYADTYSYNKKDTSKEGEETNTYEDETRNIFIYGRHPVIEALKGDTPVNKVWIGENTRDTSDIVEFIKDKNIPYKIVNKLKLNSMVGENTNHQGVVAEVSGKEYTEFADLIDLAQTKNVFYIMLDKVEDPHNLGAIIRTADAAGVDAIIISKHRAVGLTGIVAKTAAGALDRMKVSRVTNLPQALEELKANNVWSVGVDMDGDKVYTDTNLKGSIIVVMGGEGQGLTRLLKEKCDFVVKIPMQDAANSLNVSVATALMTYEVYKQRDFK